MATTGIIQRRDIKSKLILDPPLIGEIVYAIDTQEFGTIIDSTLVWRKWVNPDLTPVISTTNPGVNDDESNNHFIGRIWVNISTKRQFVAINVNTGAANWKEIRFMNDTVDAGSF